MKNFEPIAKKIFTSLTQEYGLEYANLDDGNFFLIGFGFALWIFIDPRDIRSDVWYVSAEENGDVLTYTLRYIQKDRFDPINANIFGNPKTFDERIEANLRVDAAWLSNKFQDILSGDKSWLQAYRGRGHYNRNVARFLAPYFRAQGLPVIIEEDN